MKRHALVGLLMLVAALACAQPPQETRAVWLATIGGIDWPRTYATSAATIGRQQRELTDMLDRLKAVNINTILLQTRVRGTVIYPSRLEPWDGCMSGKPGTAPGYDPLAFAVDECHKRGMKIQAWVVTIPVGKWNALGCRRLRQRHPQLIRQIGDEGYMNPEHPQTADVLADICEEIARNYNVDGIHLDYIRYPETWKLRVSRQQGRENITRIVRKIHDRIKAVKPKLALSCSPIGKHDDLARYPSRGWNARQTVCQDAQAWLGAGLMDELYPMMYFKENNFYPFAIDWAEHSRPGQVAAGLGIYFLDPKEGNWRIGEVKRQLSVCRQLGLGQCFFRARFLLNNVQGLYDYLRIFNFAAEGQLSRLGVAAQPKNAPPAATAAPAQATATTAPGYLPCDGRRARLPEKPAGLDADRLLVTSIAGNAITTLPWRGNEVDVSALPCGVFTLHSLNRRGVTHRIGLIEKHPIEN